MFAVEDFVALLILEEHLFDRNVVSRCRDEVRNDGTYTKRPEIFGRNAL